MITLPASPAQVLAQVIVPTLHHLLPAKFDSERARVQLLAMAGQESNLATRRQGGGGPAPGLWQAEQGGSIRGVLTSSATSQYARSVCLLLAVAPVESEVYAGLLSDDALACAFARLTLWADPHPLPALDDEEAAWGCYLRNWRPGAYTRGDDEERSRLRARWHGNYAAALQAVMSYACDAA